MKRTRTKLIALFISLVLISTVFPLQVFATDSGSDVPPSETQTEPGTTVSSPTVTGSTDPLKQEEQTEPDRFQSFALEGAPTEPEQEETTVPTEPEQEQETEMQTYSGKFVSGRFVLVGTSENPSANENPYQIWLDIPFEVEEGTDAWALTEKALSENGYTFTESPWGGNHLQKLSPPADKVGQIELDGGVTNGSKSFWMWSYNDNIDLSAHEYLVQEGDVIRWYFSNDWEQEYFGHPDKFYPETGNTIAVDATAKRPSDLTSWWPAFGSSMVHNSTKELDILLDGFEATEVFTFQKEGGWMDSFSDPIQVGEWIFVTFSDTLYKLERDGSVAAEAKLEFMIDSTARLAYADGLILVPIKYGKVQALTADSLTTVWIADAPAQILLQDPNSDLTVPHSQQSLTSLKVVEGVVFQGSCTVGWAPRSYGGSYRALSLKDGSTIWEYSSTESGFYWSGGAVLNGVVVVGNDLGEVFAFDAATGSIVDEMTLPAASDGLAPAIRTNMISLDNQIYFISQQDGTLHRLDINSDGTFGALKSVKFCDGGSTASPTISDGKVFAAGPGTLAVINAATMTVEKTYEIDGAIQGTPLVVKDNSGRTFVYFTINKEPGAIYGVTTDEDSVHTIYTPDEDKQNYCMASVSIGADGTLYYSNDSHTFFAVRLAEKETPQVELPATGESQPLQSLLISVLFFTAAAAVLIFRYRLKKSRQ
ncbi:MAG: PQQ-binding-like beta-propeller repeat protein [Eubacteriales bacterium]|nr:PQQ-binding-like beta-propeller repeat protein [Eubacteriales bacterium]